MKLTPIGTGAAYTGAGEACSGFVIQERKTNLLVDCGNGVLGSLQKYLDLSDITDIYISHFHADHFFDLIPFRYYLYYGLHASADKRVQLYIPPGGKEVLDNVVSYFAETTDFFEDTFKITEYQPGEEITLTDFSILPVTVKHYIPSFGFSIRGEYRVAYSSDSGECEGLNKLAEGADIFVCNTGDSLNNGRTDNWGHLKPEKAGEIAEKAGARMLVLTHLLPGSDRQWCLESAAARFKGRVELASSGASYELD